MKVIGYTRVSTNEQADEGLSLSTQRAAIADYCARRGWELADVIEDAGFSGRKDDRPGYQRLIATMGKRNRPDAVVVARLDRLTRSLKGLVDLLDKADRRWGLVAIDMDLNTTSANGQLVVHIIGAVAHWESRMNSERTSAGMRAAHEQARADGKVLGFQVSTPPEVVQRIVRARRRGEPYHRIAARLDRQRVPTPSGGARWYPSTVARIVKRHAEAVAS